MTRDEVIRYYRDRLKEAHKELDDFEACVAKYNLRVLHRTNQEPERDETDQHRKWLKNAVDEYQGMLVSGQAVATKSSKPAQGLAVVKAAGAGPGSEDLRRAPRARR